MASPANVPTGRYQDPLRAEDPSPPAEAIQPTAHATKGNRTSAEPSGGFDSFLERRGSVDTGSDAAAIIGRLHRLEAFRETDSARVENAIERHLRALGIDPRPVTWVEQDPENPLVIRHGAAGFLAAAQILRPATATIIDGSFKPLHGSLIKSKGILGEAAKAMKLCGHSVASEANYAAKAVDEQIDDDLDRLNMSSQLISAVEAALSERGFHKVAKVGSGTAGADALVKNEATKASAAVKAAEAAKWSARAHTIGAAGLEVSSEIQRVIDVYLPLVEATEAGLWLFWITPHAVLAVGAPSPHPRVVVNRPRSSVWNTFTNTETWSRWHKFGGGIKSLDPGWQEGAAIKIDWLDQTIASVIPEASVKIVGAKGDQEWTFETAGEQRTLVTCRTSSSDLQYQLDFILLDLKKYVESEPSSR